MSTKIQNLNEDPTSLRRFNISMKIHSTSLQKIQYFNEDSTCPQRFKDGRETAIGMVTVTITTAQTEGYS